MFDLKSAILPDEVSAVAQASRLAGQLQPGGVIPGCDERKAADRKPGESIVTRRTLDNLSDQTPIGILARGGWL